ncbi:MAG: DoxX family membrane protein [Polyangiaceae bacterium]
MSARVVLRWLLAVAMVAIGIGHFVNPTPFVKIVPSFLPAPLALVYVSGVFEVLGGVGVLIERVRKLASYGLVALYVAVFPANINMAVNHIQIGDTPVPEAMLWLRLPLQVVLIVWALWVGRDDKSNAST